MEPPSRRKAAVRLVIFAVLTLSAGVPLYFASHTLGLVFWLLMTLYWGGMAILFALQSKPRPPASGGGK